MTPDRVSSEPRPSQELPPLAEAKLAAPRQRRGMVRRPRIERALDAGADMAVTLVVAPAGYGKTTAVRDWSEGNPAAFAWVTLDGLDNDLVRLWTYVSVAVDRVREGLSRRALKRLHGSGTTIEDAIDELMNGIAVLGREFTLVLDDLHTVTAHECLASIEYAIGRLPATARIILITRADPALGLARWRARGELLELRASELAFTAAEARELLADRGGLRLDDAQIETLVRRTEGWPAALYLAALWLRTVDDLDRAVLEFGGEHRYVAEYLSHEVLAALDADRRAFLLRVAVLGGFTVKLCDAVLGRADSAILLAELEESNMFVQSLERGEWFRVHPLFAEFAAAQLASEDSGAVVEIHRRAAESLRSQGLYVEATAHAFQAGDHEVVADMMTKYHLALIRNGRAGTLLRWTRTLPDDCLLGHPELAGAAATAATMLGHLALERRRLLGLATRAKTEHPDRIGVYVDAMLQMVRAAGIDRGVSEAISDGRRAVQLADGAADEVFVAAHAALAGALYFAGAFDDAWAAALRAIEHPDAARRPPGHALARATLALVAADRGWLATARGHAEQARLILGRINSNRSWLGANTAVATGVVLVGEGDLASAEREFALAEQFFRDEIATIHHAHVLVRLAGVRCGRGRLDEADATLRQAQDAIAELRDSGIVPGMAADVADDLARRRAQASVGRMLESPTEAELAVLQLLPSDLSAREIGEQLFLSANTVRSHTRSIYRKLSVGSREAAVARATVLGLLETPSPR
jgi:LuxR family transcriptional regulator, maltose regulon positive regulatory protein